MSAHVQIPYIESTQRFFNWKAYIIMNLCIHLRNSEPKSLVVV